MSTQSTTVLIYLNTHSYFAKYPSGYVQVHCSGASPRVSAERVNTERYTPVRELTREHWCGKLRPGLCMTDGANAVRAEWLQAGIVPSCTVRGFNEFNRITRTLSDGECTVKSLPMYDNDNAQII